MLAIDAAAHSSPWRRVHPAVKGTLFGGLLACALVLPVWPGAALSALAALAVGFGPARVPPRAFARAAWVPLLFVLTGAVTMLVSVGGPDAVLAWAPDGWRRAAEVAGRAAAALCCQLMFAFSTPLADLLPRLARLGLPTALVETVALTYRMLFVLLDTARRIRTAQAGRLGYQTRAAWVRSLGVLGAAVFVRSFERARRMRRGLECRGYEGELTVLVDTPPVRPAALLAAALPPLSVAAAALHPGMWP
ncbi:cobalt ECF transporter T component CbiQ [Marinitenerispora sediminis]|uniref:Cobalt ECF transporter T component CbiQ n=1 Tax=Marinitenerispora sediminis TaxID=1931232 RepID=A0A368TB94_9ACTN|nr:cobalt ECF transporter T component CbiQ [Marinitenerispora sediminis]RCV52040.1 cobalt ECF transporter T component CbiQ [Marinitenerispora sediminis]RCV54691.1 cobalt ECF transporter T component CbiQ [Marinitenerispora sediminis]RCV60379.1 cobalt ECF transporter T component CbiQ [Marinitenerispora sediminis]